MIEQVSDNIQVLIPDQVARSYMVGVRDGVIIVVILVIVVLAIVCATRKKV
jgi:hypothetical protein